MFVEVCLGCENFKLSRCLYYFTTSTATVTPNSFCSQLPKYLEDTRKALPQTLGFNVVVLTNNEILFTLCNSDV